MKKLIITIASIAFIGTFLVSVKPASAACAVTSFTADQYTITAGSSTTVSWTSSGCDTISITPAQYPGNRPPAASTGTGALYQTTTFTATGYDASGNAGGSRTLTITVTQSGTGGGSAQCAITSFTAAAYGITYGGSTTVSWTSSGCDTISITPAQYPGNRPPTGSTGTGVLFQTTTFIATGYNAAGVAGTSRSLTITVSSFPDPVAQCVINSFTAGQYSVVSGGSTTVSWISSGCDTVSITPANNPSNRPPTGSTATGALYQTTTFTVVGYAANGTAGTSRSLTISVNGASNNGCSVDSFSTDAYSITSGDSTRLRWGTSGCDYVTISGYSGQQSASGTITVYPTSTRTYTLTAYPGAITARVTVNVYDNNSGNSCYVSSFYADDSSISDGDSTVIRWRTVGGTNIDITPGFYDKSSSGSITVYPHSTTTYRINVSGNNCSDSQSLTVTVGGGSTTSRPQAITTAAIGLGGYSAQLNGIAVPNTSSGNTTAWFEWGPSTSLGSKTGVRTITSSGSTNYSDTIYGMTPNVAYYYRAAVQNRNGTAYGDIVKIPVAVSYVESATTTTTRRSTVNTSTRVQQRSVANSNSSLLELKVQSAYEKMCIDGEMDYTISYRNVSNTRLDDAVLRLSLPKELDYISGSRGGYDKNDRIITIDLGTLNTNEQGNVTIRTRVNNNAVENNLTVMTATIVYTNSDTTAQESAIAYSLVTVSNDCPNVLGASVFGFSGFLPHTLIEWLLLILIIFALILLGRNLYKKKEEKKA